MKKQQFTIITIIVEQNLVQFKEKVAQYCKGKEIIEKKTGVSIVPISNGAQMGMLPIPHCYIEHTVTEEEHRIWKFGQTIKV